MFLSYFSYYRAHCNIFACVYSVCSGVSLCYISRNDITWSESRHSLNSEDYFSCRCNCESLISKGMWAFPSIEEGFPMGISEQRSWFVK